MTTDTLTSPAATSTWTIDASHSQVEFAVKHMMISTVKGRVPAMEGTLALSEDDVTNSSVGVTFDVSSIDTGTPMRDDHLRSADFFDVATFPKISFTSTGITGSSLADGAGLTLQGDLTIRDVTRPVVLDVTVEGRGRDPYGNDRIAFTAAPNRTASGRIYVVDAAGGTPQNLLGEWQYEPDQQPSRRNVP